MLRHFIRILGLYAFLLTVGLQAAFATTSLYISDTEQAQLSTAVVIAKIAGSEVLPHDRYDTVMTRTELRVEEVLFGSAPSTITIHQIGGTLGGQTVYVPGDARFENGELCVLFVRKIEDRWFLTAMEQSKYSLTENAKFGPLMTRTLSHSLVTRNDQGDLVNYEEPIRPPIKRLKVFRQQLSALLPKGGAR